jgi:hypothetical protein
MADGAAYWHTRMTMPRGTTSKKTAKRKAAKAKKTTAKKPAKQTTKARAPSRKAAAMADAPMVTARARGNEGGLTPIAAEKLRRVAYRDAALKGERDAWVKAIRDPKMRALAEAAPRICDLFGIPTDVLRTERKDQSPASKNENSMRMLALGAIVGLGVSMGMAWNELHCDPNTGRCDVLDMPSHAFTIRQAHDRWVSYQDQAGHVPEMVRSRFAEIQSQALNLAATRAA